MNLISRASKSIVVATLAFASICRAADTSLGPSLPCPIGWYDGANCQMGTAPTGSQGFVFNGQLYYNALVQPSCPQAGSWWDGAHCHLPDLPSGTAGFIWNANPYYTYSAGADRCPMQGSWDDGAHCQVMHPSGSSVFLYEGELYYWLPSCPVAGSWWDGAHCEMPNVPAGSTPFVWQNVNLDYTPAWKQPTGAMLVKVADIWGNARQNVVVTVGSSTGVTNSQGTVCLTVSGNAYVNVTAGPVTNQCKTSFTTCAGRTSSDCYISY
jgi:hypothetical protein